MSDESKSLDDLAESMIGKGAMVVGLLFMFSVLKKFLSACFKLFLRPGKNLKKLGEWAVVTGATDGIGKAYAMELAKKGLNIVLISRTESKLNDVKKEIMQKYSNVSVKCVVCDYSNFDKITQDRVKKSIDDLDIGVLINNVGLSYRYPRYYDELTDEEIDQILKMNIDSVVWMTRIVLPGMLSRSRGAIVNISSGSAMYTLPLLTMYSGAKSFVEKFSRALNAEYSSKNNITVSCQIPFYVSTKLAKMRPSFSVPTPQSFAKMGIKWIGHHGDHDVIVQPYWVHALMGWALDKAPEWLVVKVIRDMHLATRKRGIKKDAANATEDSKKTK